MVTVVTLEDCPRCGEDHHGIDFRAFTREPAPDCTHFVMCPKLNEPILFCIIKGGLKVLSTIEIEG